MADFPAVQDYNQQVISSLSVESVGVGVSCLGGGGSSAVWPVANQACFVPFQVYVPSLIQQLMIWNGTAVSGNVDVGVYTQDGTRVVSSGSTAQAGTSQVQAFNVTDTQIPPGSYYMAQVLDNATGTFLRPPMTAVEAAVLGVLAQTSAFPLPSTATFAAAISTGVPQIAAFLRSLV